MNRTTTFSIHGHTFIISYSQMFSGPSALFTEIYNVGQRQKLLVGAYREVFGEPTADVEAAFYLAARQEPVTVKII
jgi:hypothetical protein